MNGRDRTGIGRPYLVGAAVLALGLVALGVTRLGGGFLPASGGSDQLCHRNLSFIAEAMLRYVADSGDILPQPERWHDALCPGYLENKPVPCPERPNTDCGYGYNAALAGVSERSIVDREHTILLFESDEGWDAAGGAELLPTKPRHRGGDLYVLLNGEVVWRPRGQAADLRWKPRVGP